MAIATAFGVLSLLLLRAYNAGRTSKDVDVLKGRLDAVKHRRDLEDKVDRMSDADVDERLQRWRR